MKTIIKSILLTAVLALVMTGCQKETDDLSVSLKSTDNQTIIDSWKSGNAAFECEEAGGDCGYAYKIDEWDEEFGMDDEYVTAEGNIVTILNSNGKTFDWESDYPVCKVIVKAGRGAIIYSYPGGANHDEGLTAYKGKGISHVTFCYSEPPELIISVKAFYFYIDKNRYAESAGTPVFVTTEWCGKLGVNPYPSTPSFEMITPDGLRIGEVEVDNRDVTVTLDEGYTLITAFLYIGTLEDLTTNNIRPLDGCPWYQNTAVWMHNSTVGTNTDGLTFTHYDL